MAFDIDFVNNDFVKDVREARDYKYGFLLWPRRWQKFNTTVPLNWISFAFNESNTNYIPEEPGVYAFCVEPGIVTGLQPCYLLYIGETSRTLRARYREYLGDSRDSKSREKLYLAMNLFKDHIHFFCAPLPNNISTRQIEAELLKAFIPPTNTRFPAEVSRIVSALSTN